MARPHTKEPRSKIIMLRLTEAEYATINEMIGDKPTSSYIRKVVFSKKPIVLNSKEFLSELKEIAIERKRIGNNLNQLAKYANQLMMVNSINKGVIDDLNRNIGELIQAEKLVSKAVKDLIGRE